MNGPGFASASAAVIQRSASRETKTERYQGTCHIGATAPRLWSLVNSTSLATSPWDGHEPRWRARLSFHQSVPLYASIVNISPSRASGFAS